MPTYRSSDFEAALERLGFRRDKTHHNMFWYYLGERKTALRTRNSQILEMLNGRLTEEAYRQHLLDNGIVQAEDSEA